MSIAGNGVEALRLLEREEFRMILNGRTNAVMDGLETTRLIRGNSKMAGHSYRRNDRSGHGRR